MIIRTLIKKELAEYFSSPIAYIYILTFLFISHNYFFNHLFLYNEASMVAFLICAIFFNLACFSD